MEDSHIWAYYQDKCYTVKSRSWLAAQQKHVPVTLSPKEQEYRFLKEKIWKIKTLPKIKIFLWRALSSALAMSECLQAHGIKKDIICSQCQNARESISHVLFHSWPARDVWRIANLPIPVQGFSDSISANFTFVLKVMSDEGIHINVRRGIPWILWGIWKDMNKILYAAPQGDLNALVAHAFEEAMVWKKLGEAPPQVLNFKNHHGDVEYHARDVFMPVLNRIAVELQVIIWTLQSLADLHLDNIEIWSDCGAAIRAIEDPLNWPRYGSYLHRIHGLISDFTDISFMFSAPKANQIAR
ncbi:putative reverse transcriptase zinc-binding domain-containing protein [Arabidopsis thaliana]